MSQRNYEIVNKIKMWHADDDGPGRPLRRDPVFLQDVAKRCARISTCPTRDIWGMLGQKISETMRSVTLADLVRIRQERADNNMMSNI